MVQDNNGLGELLRHDHQVLGGCHSVLAGDEDSDLGVRFKLSRDGENGGFAEVLPGVGGHAVLRDAGRTDALVIAGHGLHRHAVRGR